jgi:hypothetical protein|nr:hypothetical protein [uncultured Acetatifactor sp.]
MIAIEWRIGIMGKLSKIILSCACTVFAIAIIGFCVWKITYTPSAASSQNNSMDITDSETDSIKITAPDGSEFIIVNPPVPNSDPNLNSYEWGITNFDHSEGGK